MWSFLTDVERLPEWLGEFEAAHDESDGPAGRGSAASPTIAGDRSGTFEIVEWDPPRRFAWDGPPLQWAGGAARPRGSHELTETGDGRTLLVSRYQPELTGTQVLLRPYLKRWLRRRRKGRCPNAEDVDRSRHNVTSEAAAVVRTFFEVWPRLTTSTGSVST